MDQEKPKILIVDDDTASREIYVSVFKNSNFEVIEGNDGIEGLDSASKNPPDVILTGIIMPRMDGFSMMEELKKNVVTSSIPVIIFSHMGREEDQKKANALGATEFIYRDMVTPVQVVDKIKSILGKSASYRIIFDAYSLDAPKLARDLRLDNDLQCMECDETMVLKLDLVDPRKKKFEARFICPNCGWMPK